MHTSLDGRTALTAACPRPCRRLRAMRVPAASAQQPNTQRINDVLATTKQPRAQPASFRTARSKPPQAPQGVQQPPGPSTPSRRPRQTAADAAPGHVRHPGTGASTDREQQRQLDSRSGARLCPSAPPAPPASAPSTSGRDGGGGMHPSAWRSIPLLLDLSAVRVPREVRVQRFSGRLYAPPDNPAIPSLDALVIVEGFNDCLAVHRAVRAPVFVLGGGFALAEEMVPELILLQRLCRAGALPAQIVVFTDPDWQGRQFRAFLDDKLCMHGITLRQAFLRVEMGTSEQDTRYHEAGDVGVEHARPDTIRTCLRRARPSFPSDRSEFTLQELQDCGLVGTWNDNKQVPSAKARRQAFCQALGIDEVGTGKGLLNLLNRFFTRDEFSAAWQLACSQHSEAEAEPAVTAPPV